MRLLKSPELTFSECRQSCVLIKTTIRKQERKKKNKAEIKATAVYISIILY